MDNKHYTIACLRGLLQTDGSIYKDRGYVMINFVNHSKQLAEDVARMIAAIRYLPHMQEYIYPDGRKKYTVRISKNAAAFAKEINYWKK